MMRDRLTEIVKPFVSGSACEHESGSCELTDCRSCNARSLADHLLADGWIRPPCKVGDKLYCIIPKCNAPYNYCPYNGGYGTARCDKEPCKAYIKEISFSLSDIENIGKTVFLTKEEAARALAKRDKK
jgi:hypothetical protein